MGLGVVDMHAEVTVRLYVAIGGYAELWPVISRVVNKEKRGYHYRQQVSCLH